MLLCRCREQCPGRQTSGQTQERGPLGSSAYRPGRRGPEQPGGGAAPPGPSPKPTCPPPACIWGHTLRGQKDNRNMGWGSTFPPPPPGGTQLTWRGRGTGVRAGCSQHAGGDAENSHLIFTTPGSHGEMPTAPRSSHGQTGARGAEGSCAPRPAPGQSGARQVHSVLSVRWQRQGVPWRGQERASSCPQGPHRLCDKSVSPQGFSDAAAASGSALQRPVLPRRCLVTEQMKCASESGCRSGRGALPVTGYGFLSGRPQRGGDPHASLSRPWCRKWANCPAGIMVLGTHSTSPAIQVTVPGAV